MIIWIWNKKSRETVIVENPFFMRFVNSTQHLGRRQKASHIYAREDKRNRRIYAVRTQWNKAHAHQPSYTTVFAAICEIYETERDKNEKNKKKMLILYWISGFDLPVSVFGCSKAQRSRKEFIFVFVHFLCAVNARISLKPVHCCNISCHFSSSQFCLILWRCLFWFCV